MRVKICGLTRLADWIDAAEYGADAVGLNFYAKSKRYLPPAQAAEMAARAPAFAVPFGVFVEEPLRRCCAIAYQIGLRAIQWVGDIIPANEAGPFAWVPAFRVAKASDLQAIDRYLAANPNTSAVLVDSHAPGEMGGTGRLGRWDLLADYRPSAPMILAGGLTPDNVAEAVRRVRPAGVDVASGVESSPGIKDPHKVRDFIQAAKGAT